MAAKRNAIFGAAGAAVLLLVSGCARSDEVCMTTSLPMVEGKTDGCYSKSELRRMKTRKVVEGEGRPAILQLAHPTDFALSQSVSTCKEFQELTEEGWYPLTSRDMRREAVFDRACGAIEMLLTSKRPDVTFFVEGKCSRADIASLPAAAMPGFGEETRPSGPLQALVEAGTVSLKGEAGAWVVSMENRSAVVQELAHADFNDDGVGDILAFIYLRAKGGTAATGTMAVLTKSAEDAALQMETR